MNGLDLVSIIIPVYNMGDSLEESLNSILTQDYPSIEVILVDDGSSDNSLEICKSLAEKDSRVTYVHTENRGSGPARNTGIEMSRGKYLYFPDADDFLASDAISTLVEAIGEDSVDLVVFGYREATREGTVLREKQYENFSQDGDIIRDNYSEFFAMDRRFGIQGAPWNKFFDGDVVRENGIEYPPLRRHQDEGFIARYMSVARKVKFISAVLYTYYPNTVGLEWKKYPTDYYEAVKGLSDVWAETICKWNSENNTDIVKREILSKYVKAFELSYSPKMNMTSAERRRWLKTVCKKTEFDKTKLKHAWGLYQKLILISAKMKQFWLMTVLLRRGVSKRQSEQGD